MTRGRCPLARARARIDLQALFAALVLSAAGPTARAEQADEPRSVFVRLAPSADNLHNERTAALERRLAELLSAWPGVTHAAVHLTLPRPDAEPLDRPLPAPRAAVVLTRSTDQPQAEAVLKLLQSALPALGARDLTVLDHTPTEAANPNLVLGPASLGAQATARSVSNASATSNSELRVALATSLAVNALLAAIMLWRLRRHRPAAQKVDPQARLPFPP